jgi:voltage-gated potassium channel Kch
MIKTLLLMIVPVATWEKIYRAQKSFAFVLVLYLLPLLVLSAAGESYGMIHWGKYRGEIQRLRTFSPAEAAIFEMAQFVWSLLVVFFGAIIVRSLGATFHGRHTYTQTFTVVAYGLGPVFMFRLLNAFSYIPAWAPWLLGTFFAWRVLYSGIPKVMLPDPPHAIGLYLMSNLILTFMTGLLALLAYGYLQGVFPKLEKLISGAAAGLRS